MDDVRNDLLEGQPVVINVGLSEFFESLVDQGVQVIHVDWQPPAAGNEELLKVLDELL